ncbi:hypothetical protein MVEN_02235000 [Mycena venus]|uniref:DUF6533 domain-containing protein n=1 Tax=Mycena venus TaxID=2733690 RepID=A0A8H6X758_9AGAR|nr:hypothetical protein MVEN_02235000 [Mycena venus]
MTETLNDAQIQDAIFICRILIIVPFTVLVYEYLLTLQREVSGFWGSRLTWASFFFYVNRYSPLVGNLPILIQYYSTTTDPDKLPVRCPTLFSRQALTIPQLCRVFRAYHQYFALLSQVLVAVMLIMRTYALYERNRKVLAFTILVTLGAFTFAVWILLTGNDTNTLSAQISAFGCPLGTSHSKSLRLAAAWSGMLVFDVTIFGLTLLKALRLNARQGDLLTVLIRDGSVYFALMIISNACNIGTYTMGNPFTRGSATTVTNVVSSVMITRLMFNLRDPKIRIRTPLTSNRTTTTEDYPAISTVSPYTNEYTMNTQWSTAS